LPADELVGDDPLHERATIPTGHGERSTSCFGEAEQLFGWISGESLQDFAYVIATIDQFIFGFCLLKADGASSDSEIPATTCSEV